VVLPDADEALRPQRVATDLVDALTVAHLELDRREVVRPHPLHQPELRAHLGGRRVDRADELPRLEWHASLLGERVGRGLEVNVDPLVDGLELGVVVAIRYAVEQREHPTPEPPQVGPRAQVVSRREQRQQRDEWDDGRRPRVGRGDRVGSDASQGSEFHEYYQ